MSPVTPAGWLILGLCLLMLLIVTVAAAEGLRRERKRAAAEAAYVPERTRAGWQPID